MRVVFMGAPRFAVPTLDALAALGAEIVAVYSKAPKPGGRRGLELTKTPVHVRADALGLTTFTPKSFREAEAVRQFVELRPDLAVVAAYGLILPPEILAAPHLGCVNLHGSLLPRWRGAAPIQRAIMAGDLETGVGLMRMEAGLDTGPVAREARTGIRGADTAGDLGDRLSHLAADLLRDCWPDLIGGTLTFRTQSEVGATYARKIDKAETRVDWTADAMSVRNHIHGLSPAPGAYAELPSGPDIERIKFLRVEAVDGHGAPGTILDDDFLIACGEGAIRAIEAQRAGRGPMRGADIVRGGKIRVGDRFTPSEAPPPAPKSSA